jgi:hypothetical protein
MLTWMRHPTSIIGGKADEGGTRATENGTAVCWGSRSLKGKLNDWGGRDAEQIPGLFFPTSDGVMFNLVPLEAAEKRAPTEVASQAKLTLARP